MSEASLITGGRTLASLRAFDLIAPQAVVTWANEQLLAFEEPSDALLALASETRDVRAEEVDSLLDDLLIGLGDDPLTFEQAGWNVARTMAERIVGGSVRPVDGASKIWSDVARRVPELEPRLTAFGALSSQWDDSPDFRDALDEEIVEEARALLSERLEPNS